MYVVSIADSRLRDAPEMPRRVDYLFAAMRSALFGGVGIGVVSTASLHVAAGGWIRARGVSLAVGLVRFPR